MYLHLFSFSIFASRKVSLLRTTTTTTTTAITTTTTTLENVTDFLERKIFVGIPRRGFKNSTLDLRLTGVPRLYKFYRQLLGESRNKWNNRQIFVFLFPSIHPPPTRPPAALLQTLPYRFPFHLRCFSSLYLRTYVHISTCIMKINKETLRYFVSNRALFLVKLANRDFFFFLFYKLEKAACEQRRGIYKQNGGRSHF